VSKAAGLKNKKNKPAKNKPTKFKMPLAGILLDGAYYDFDFFFDNFKKKWDFPEISPYRDKDAFGIIVDGMVIGCTFTPSSVINPGLMQNARESVLWPNAEAQISKHNAHLTLALTREKDPVSSHILFSKVISSLLQQRNVCGVYLCPGLFEPAYYIKCAEVLLEAKLPTELWVHINCPGTEKGSGVSFYTSGMYKFGKKEFEIIETNERNFIDAYYLLKKLIEHVIKNNVDFKNGDKMGSDDDKGALSVSNGVYIKGPSIKIGV